MPKILVERTFKKYLHTSILGINFPMGKAIACTSICLSHFILFTSFYTSLSEEKCCLPPACKKIFRNLPHFSFFNIFLVQLSKN